ncbi:MAG: AmmeMemoRadiSam system radical SAM enzyme [Planctomycetales bacterium]|nr:AmmeMemoRadiSam system radical SAM enzyme [Planctomycetales bacterium]NIM09979.1 AmmeMemoRadiSam system radical SAM enzyme [Planctomycetales bacterium]NIN09417.1 AmmeMemoRadiSam system radical SAM enzyme [Planctomycetales bacterium]NIN78524.1 AmmeMemoRadiSam system radical SAM enzyme [Planctomycetales bacterium]NIO35717.1 AmmeMemoRadiSam system radical SAM enzyme [Planctomycetales bacterium]
MNKRTVAEPPGDTTAGGLTVGGWWHTEGSRIVCDLCPRACSLKDGDFGFCFVRQNIDGQMVLNTYGRSTGFCIDPVEKKPLNHFYPGSSVLSFGTAGCNLGCKFCQAWEITKSHHVLNRLSRRATPEMIAAAAQRLGCHSVAFTYNDPVIWAEYAIDTARACHQRGLKTIAVTAGYITPQARSAFFAPMDAANVDLKGFTETFYQRYTLSHLQPVLDTLCWLKHHSRVWLEITNLVIPAANDDRGDIDRMCGWIVENLGPEVPLHLTAFHPDFRMRDRPPTPPDTLIAAYELARAAGLKYVYTGNVLDEQRQSTYCPSCRKVVIQRNRYDIGACQIRAGHCGFCGSKIAGHFAETPGHWGTRRLPVDPAAVLHELESAQQRPPAAGERFHARRNLRKTKPGLFQRSGWVRFVKP